jgi:hypothetical protein
MQTTKQIQRRWKARQYPRLMRELMAARPESSLRAEAELTRSVHAAAMGIIRLDELNQPQVPLCRELLHCVLLGQDRDGGWGDAMTTALCIRALRCCNGQGEAIRRGLSYLANLQKSEGIWPKEPLRRMPADPFVSAFVMLQLGQDADFREAVRFNDAVNWLANNASEWDGETRRLWDRAAPRCRVRRVETAQLWS